MITPRCAMSVNQSELPALSNLFGSLYVSFRTIAVDGEIRHFENNNRIGANSVDSANSQVPFGKIRDCT